MFNSKHLDKFIFYVLSVISVMVMGLMNLQFFYIKKAMYLFFFV